jgi:LuxR family transcriptional regulator, maltose regulon positive regulatory protein
MISFLVVDRTLGSMGSRASTASPERRRAMPATRSDYVVRQRLFELLDRGVQRSLTLISAPAGTGKTALVASWAATWASSCPWPLVWITLDDTDAEPDSFWGRLAAGLQSVGVVISDGDPGESEPADSWPVSRLVASLTAHPRPVVVVLDAGATPSNPARDRALGDVALRAKGALRLVMIARSDPVLPMQWFRLSGELAEIRVADLAANETEIVELASRVGLVVTLEQARALCAQTSGWMIALKFAVMSLAGSQDVSLAIERFKRTDFDVVTYLFNEVIDALPVEIRDLLLRTSIADVLTPALVDLLAGRSQGDDVLEFLANGNQFIERSTDSAGRTYHYQPLFRDFLRAQLAFENPQLADQLRRSAEQHQTRDNFTQDAVLAAVPASRAGEPTPFVRSLTAIAAAGPPPAESVIDPLTPRELEVLQHLAGLKPTVEIATSMFVSVNTVRTHIRSILHKLGVGRRHEAVRRAWMLGLLPPPGDGIAHAASEHAATKEETAQKRQGLMR